MTYPCVSFIQSAGGEEESYWKGTTETLCTGGDIENTAGTISPDEVNLHFVGLFFISGICVLVG